MKQKTIITLLCTTIILPSISMAAEQPSQPDTPIHPNVARVRNQPQGQGTPISNRISTLQSEISALPSTPDLKNQALSKYPSQLYSPVSQEFLAGNEAARKKDEKDAKKESKEAEIEQLRLQKRLEAERAAAQEERTRLTQAAQLEIQQAAAASRESELRLTQEIENLSEQIRQAQVLLQTQVEEQSRSALSQENINAQLRQAQERIIEVEAQAQSAQRTAEENAEQVRIAQESQRLAEERQRAESRRKAEILESSRQRIDGLQRQLDEKKAELLRVQREKAQQQEENLRLQISAETQSSLAAQYREGMLAAQSRQNGSSTISTSGPISLPVLLPPSINNSGAGLPSVPDLNSRPSSVTSPSIVSPVIVPVQGEGTQQAPVLTQQPSVTTVVSSNGASTIGQETTNSGGTKEVKKKRGEVKL